MTCENKINYLETRQIHDEFLHVIMTAEEEQYSDDKRIKSNISIREEPEYIAREKKIQLTKFQRPRLNQ